MRAKLRARYLLPGLLVVGVAVVGLLTSGAALAVVDGAATLRRAATWPARAQVGRRAPTAAHHATTCRRAPTSRRASRLFELNCSSCHGADASGTDRAPNLQGLGPATVDFWVSTGRMPLAVATAQPVQKPPRFDRKQTLQIVAFVNSLAPTAPDYPLGHPAASTWRPATSPRATRCSCSTARGATPSPAPVTPSSDGYVAPSLHKIYPRQIAEAIRTGPTHMPHFGPGNLTNQQVADIVAYVTGPIQHPDNQGGLGLGGIGPVAEGFIGPALRCGRDHAGGVLARRPQVSDDTTT